MDHLHLLRRARLGIALTLVIASATAVSACVEGAPQGAQAAATPGQDLSTAPWADAAGPHRIQDLTPLPSLTFAVGIDYPGALERPYVAARTGAGAVADAEVSAPLPAEVVYVAPDDPGKGLRLSLTAPWGWVPGGAIRPPSISLPGSLSSQEVSRRVAQAAASGTALPEGAHVDVPNLEACQIGHGAPDNRHPC